MSVFQHQDYRGFLRERLAQMPKKGRGEVQRIADAIGVHPTLVSQVLGGAKDFTLEQGHALCEYLGLLNLEADYFLTLIQIERAGSKKLKDYFKAKLKGLKESSLQVARRVPQDRSLTETEKATFYSHWLYSAISLQTSIDGYHSIEALAEKFQLPRAKVSEILQFLVATGLCTEKNGRYEMGARSTHLELGSPFLAQHYMNWRMKSMQKAASVPLDELMFTAPMSLSEKDFVLLREDLVAFIKRVYEVVRDSKSETLACLNIDWIRVER